MSNDLVVQLGAKLDQFASDMNQAGDMADTAVGRIEQSFASLNPGLGGFGTAFGVATAGIVGLLAYVVSLNKELADMQDTAKQVGLTLKDFQGVQFGGQVAGLSGDQVNDGLQKSAQLLNDASRNSNTLSKELEANGLSVKNSNGQLITQNQLLSIAAGLVSNAANPQDAIKIAQMLGFTKEWVPLLEQGAAAMGTLSDQAVAAGAVIDDETIKKAKDFTTEWQKSSAEWSTYMKAAIADMLPEMDDLIKKAVDFIKSVKDKGGGAGGFVKTTADGVLNAAGIDPQAGISIDTKGLDEALQTWQNSPIFSTETWSALGRVFAAAATIQHVDSPYAVSQDPMGGGSYPKTGPKNFDDLQKQIDHAQDDAQDANDSHTKIPGKDDGKDAVDQAIDSLQKHTLATQADADAVGLSAGALAGFRADAVEQAAVLKSGKTETDAQSDSFGDLKDAAIAAADALAKAKVASDISRGSQTALFTPQDLAIANQLKGIYGDNIPAAMESSEAAALRFNATIKDLGTLGQQVNSGFLVDFETQIRNGASAMQALQTAGVNALGKIADKLASMAADNLWASAFGGSTGGAGSFFSSIFGGGATGAVNANGSITGAVGATSVGGAPLVGAFASGTDSAPGGLSLIGEHGPELLNIPRGAQVIPNDVLKGGGGGGTTVHTGTSITIQGSADQATLILMQQALAQRDAELPSRVISAVTLAKKQRKLS